MYVRMHACAGLCRFVQVCAGVCRCVQVCAGMICAGMCRYDTCRDVQGCAGMYRYAMYADKLVFYLRVSPIYFREGLSMAEERKSATCMRARIRTLGGWRNTVEIVLFEISNSMKPYPSVFHTYTSTLRPAIGLFDPRATRRGFQPYSAHLSNVPLHIYLSLSLSLSLSLLFSLSLYVYIYIHIHIRLSPRLSTLKTRNRAPRCVSLASSFQ